MFSVVSERFKSFDAKNNSIFTLKTVSENVVHKKLLKLNPYKITGLDNIQSKFIQDGASFLKIPITFIIIESISSSTFPDDKKTARVQPIHKKNSSLEVGYYRLISILSVVSKIFERSVHMQLAGFLESNDILYEFQSGFRSKFSTESCLIHLFDFIKDNTTKGLNTGMAMLDLYFEKKNTQSNWCWIC
jgi:hypothetical protein